MNACESVNWIQLVEGMVQRRALVNTVTDICRSLKRAQFLCQAGDILLVKNDSSALSFVYLLAWVSWIKVLNNLTCHSPWLIFGRIKYTAIGIFMGNYIASFFCVILLLNC
jgi:hypothetical protein